jgi:hypothetical protein
MLLVIFGAGASFDSSPPVRQTTVDPVPPPLAQDLVSPQFARIAREVPTSQQIIARLRRRMTADPPGSLESELAALSTTSATSAVRRQQLAAFRFYLYRVIEQTVEQWLHFTHGFTNYIDLLDPILDWHEKTGAPVRLATFNYDVMLDRAVEHMLNYRFTGFADYISREDVRLFKLHGSTSWSRVIPTELDDMSTVNAAMALAAENELTGGEFRHAPVDNQVRGRQSPQDAKPRETTIPAIAVPMAGKTDFECPEPLLDALRADLPSVTHLLIVGWRAAEPHAVKLLDACKPVGQLSLGIVTKGEDGLTEVRRNLGEVFARSSLRAFDTNGFSHFIAEIDEHMRHLLPLTD